MSQSIRPYRFLSVRPVLVVMAVALGLAGCRPDAHHPDRIASAEPARFAELNVSIERGDTQAMMFANRGGAFFYDAVATPQTAEAMGFVVGGFRMLDGWRWWFPQDSVGLSAADVSRASVRPDFAVRAYEQADVEGFLPRLIRRFRGPDLKRLTEVITLGEGALVVNVTDSLGTVDLFPAFSDRRSDGYEVQTAADGFAVARSDYLEPRAGSLRPVWVAIVGDDARSSVEQIDLERRFPESLGERNRAHAPGRLRMQTPGSVAFGTGMTAEEAMASARNALVGRDDHLAERQRWLESVIADNPLRSADRRFNRAYDWARITLEQLVYEPDTLSVDLRPGIPGAEAQPGWNSVQALEGAFLATGQWERAASMLRLYSRNQRFDQRIDIFGRAPSRFDLDGTPRYRTADGAAVLYGALGDYLRTTGHDGLVLGDRLRFWQNPVFTQRGFDDPRQLRTAEGFIRNAPNQTWVQQPAARRDARPRGPASVEVQARYFDNLRTMERLARIMGVSSQAEEYAQRRAAFQQAFQQAFIRDDQIVDFLGEDSAADTPRPSALYALRSFDLEPDRERRILRNLAETLVYPHGVSTRPQSDSLFYPFIYEPDYYEEDVARYDGPVWTALSGPLVSLLVDHGAPGRAYEQTEALVRYVLDRGVVGGIPENVDAHPRDGHLDVGGAPVQPWSLAEFIRNAHQDYAGVRYVSGSDIVIQPNLPASWGETSTRFRVGNGWVTATMRQSTRELSVSVVPRGQVPADARLRIRGFGNERHLPLTRQVNGQVRLIDSTSVTITPNGVRQNGEEVAADARYDQPDPDFWDGFAWVHPDVRDEYPVMRRLEEERRLTPDQVTDINPVATTILARTDPVGDDWGPTATFTYPTAYPAGILDATYLQIAEDPDAYYFRIEMAALADREQFGYQPTFFALALDVEEGGAEEVGRNAAYSFPRGTGYNYIIFIGDGLRVEDEDGRVLGEFAAAEADIFDLELAVVEFALPKFVVPAIPRGSQVTLLVGVNDGGPVPGRFQEVGARATERRGGGKVNPRDPNIYDVVSTRVVR